MKRKLILFLIFSIAAAMVVTAQQPVEKVDICIYGASSAGVMAAYTAKKLGKTVALVEPGRHVGGLTTGGLGFTDIGNKFAVTGLARDFYRRIGTHYGKFEQWIFEPHVAEDIFHQYLKSVSINVFYEHRIVSADVSQGTIRSITLEQAGKPQASTNRVIEAKVFIDCSYEGDLMARAGVSYAVGREDNKAYHETYNGVQLRDKHQFPDGISPYKIPGDPASGLVWGVSDFQLPPAGTGDNKVQAYNYRVCLSRDPANRIEITQPDKYDPSHYELLARLFEKEPNRPFNLILKPDLMPNNKTDINNNGPISTDMIGMNYNYPEANYDTRAAILKEHEDYVKGLLYFIGHDTRVPKPIRDEMLTWGYPKDEYTDNNHWSPQAYIREARRMKGAYIMTQHNCQGADKVDDGVGMAAYTMDSHNIQRVVVNGMVKNEGDVQIGGFPPYPIAYRSLIPKKEECKNLLVPVCLSATHIAYGSIRMEPVFMVLAQSSAIAAVMAIDKNTTVQDVDVKTLQKKLAADPLVNGITPEILIDDADEAAIKLEGQWTKDTKSRGGYGLSYRTITADAKTKASVKFIPNIQQAGNYEVLIYIPRVPEAAQQVTITIRGEKETQKTISPNAVKIEGQTSGEWISLGEHKFRKGKEGYAQVTTGGASGVVVADAVLFLPRGTR
jgi:hypothetical protein